MSERGTKKSRGNKRKDGEDKEGNSQGRSRGELLKGVRERMGDLAIQKRRGCHGYIKTCREMN